MGVLSGIRIIEIAGVGPGPFCAMHLADLGADVITVQRLDGGKGQLGSHTSLNRGKRVIAADLKTEEGRNTVLSLVENADALIEGMRPGVMERLGLGPDVCRARNPRLVYGRMTGWGQTGPLAQMAGHDDNYVALTGAMWAASPAGQPPITPFSVVGDICGGALYLSIGLLGGILQARSSGQGCVVDAAIVDGSAHSMSLLMAAQSKGIVSEERGSSVHDASHFYATYRCADGHYFATGAVEPQFYRLLLEKLGLEADPLFAEQWNRKLWPQQKARVQAIFETRTRDQWWEVFNGTDACATPVLSPREASRHPHHTARGTFFESEGFLQASPAPRFDGKHVAPGAIPKPGQHTEEILSALQGGNGESVWAK